MEENAKNMKRTLYIIGEGLLNTKMGCQFMHKQGLKFIPKKTQIYRFYKIYNKLGMKIEFQKSASIYTLKINFINAEETLYFDFNGDYMFKEVLVFKAKPKYMKEQLIEYETAELAKEKGFDLKCNHYFSTKMSLYDKKEENHNFNKTTHHFCSQPTQKMLQEWLIKIHKIHIKVEDGDNRKFEWWLQKGLERIKESENTEQDAGIFKKYCFGTGETYHEIEFDSDGHMMYDIPIKKLKK